MIFKIGSQEKKEIEKKLANNKRSVRITKTIEKIFILGILGGILYVILNILIPGASMVDLNGELVKGYFLIELFGSLIIGCSFASWAIARAARARLASLGIGDRIDECLSIEEDCLMYTYRLQFQSLPTDRGVVAINLNEIDYVNYNELEKKITVQGNIFEEWFSDVKNLSNIDITNKENRQFIIYDYFTPSLIDELKKRSVNIQ